MRARPGQRLLDACQRAAELYIAECAPLQRETIYNEAIPSSAVRVLTTEVSRVPAVPGMQRLP
jgi:hypothetical protein